MFVNTTNRVKSDEFALVEGCYPFIMLYFSVR